MLRRVSPGTAYRFVDIARAAVVCSNGEIPFAVCVVQVLEQLCAFLGRLKWVAAFIDERGHLHVIALGGREHELPQSCRAGTRDGVGVERRLYHGEVFQLQLQPFRLESLLNYGQVIVAEPETHSYELASVLGVAVYVFAHHLIERHLYDRGDVL